MKQLINAVFAAICLAACANNNNSPAAGEPQQTATSPGSDTTTGQAKKERGPQVQLRKDSIALPPLKDSIIAEVYMQGMGKPVTFKVDVQQGNNLYVQLVAPDTANIRINQIFDPSGQSDGPFNKELTFPLKGYGTYQVVVGENQMAAQEWKGNFKIKLAVRTQ